MQTLPTFVYLIPVLTLFGLGNAPGLIVTIIFVIPTAVRLTHLGMTSVPKRISIPLAASCARPCVWPCALRPGWW